MSRAGDGPGASSRNLGSMAASARVSCGRTLMKYDDVQQPTQSPQATSMPGPPASARRMERSQSENPPAGIGSFEESDTRVEPT